MKRQGTKTRTFGKIKQLVVRRGKQLLKEQLNGQVAQIEIKETKNDLD